MTLTTDVIVTLILALTALFVAYLREQRRANDLAAQISHALQVNVEQQQSLSQRTQLDSMKDEFISTVSHELRTPLTSIRGALGLLSAGMLGKVDPKAQNLLRIASTNTDRLVRLINDILDFERLDCGRAPMQLHRCCMRELAVQSVETMTAMAHAAGVSLEIVPEQHEGPIPFDGDPDRMLQVLCNLLSNAIKFSPCGSAVRVLTRTEANGLLLSVEDHGRGIPAEKLETIFDRFQQVDPEDARQKGGTGLGLAICRSIALQHGGTICAERNDVARPGVPGSTFTLRLPRLALEDAVHPLPIQSSGAILVCDAYSATRHMDVEHQGASAAAGC